MNWELAFKSFIENNGVSMNLHREEINPTTGYMVAKAGFNLTVPVTESREAFEAVMTSYVINYRVWAEILHNPQTTYVGAWISGNIMYIDLVENVQTKPEAMVLGYDRYQKTIYDCANKQDVNLPVPIMTDKELRKALMSQGYF